MRLGRFVDLILENRCGSLAQRAFYYPYKLAGLLSSSDEVRSSAMNEFKKDVHALWAAQEPLSYSLVHVSHILNNVFLHECVYMHYLYYAYTCACDDASRMYMVKTYY